MLPATKQLLLQFSDEMDSYVRERYGYIGRCATIGLGPIVDIRRAKVSLYLRFRGGGNWPADVLVIASIEFSKPRAGHGRALLEKLVAVSVKYGYSHVALEQTLTDAGKAFALKFGFSSFQNDKNWLISIEDLAGRLASIPVGQKRSSLRSSRRAEFSEQKT